MWKTPMYVVTHCPHFNTLHMEKFEAYSTFGIIPFYRLREIIYGRTPKALGSVILSAPFTGGVVISRSINQMNSAP